MTAEKQTIWTLLPHTKAKHELLTRYLGAWFPIVGKYNRRIIFLDGFAGPGVYADGEPGSPALALDTLLNHSYGINMSDTEFVFIFNENDTDRFESLEREVGAMRGRPGGIPSNIKIHLKAENFTTLAERILERLEDGGRKLAPTFAFLDPFGYKDMPIDLIQRLLAARTCEAFIYFDFNSASRFSTSGMVDNAFRALFGCDDFMQAPPAGDPRRKSFLHDLYQRQLREVCNFPYVKSFEMRNMNGRTGYYLFFCTRDLLGLEKMKEAMWKVDPGGGVMYSDLFDGQEVLFSDNLDTGPLQNELLKVYSGQTVGIEEIKRYVLVETPFAASHIKQKTLAPMQRGGKISSPNQGRRNTYPDGTLIQFPE